MKVILRADVENLGKLGDFVEVKAGYGRNFLLPQGLAMQATPSNVKVFELERKKLQAKTEALRSVASDLAARIEKIDLCIPMRVGESDKLYGSVTSAMIIEALAQQGVILDRRRLLLDSPIRTLGEHFVRVRLHAGVQAPLMVRIIPDRPVHGDDAEQVEAGQADAQEVADGAVADPQEQQPLESSIVE